MGHTKKQGVLIYGDAPKDSVPVTWELTYGKGVSNEGSWRAAVTIDARNDRTYWDVDTDILLALSQKYIFKLRTEDGSVFPCGIYSIDGLIEYRPPGFHALIICSRDQPMEDVG